MSNPPSSEHFAPRRESWRPQRTGSDAERLLWRVALLVAGLVCVGAAGWGVYRLRHGGSSVVPVIEADSRPMRVKPDDPGGMQISGEEQQVLDGSGPAHADVMAPGPETPQPQALAAKIEAAHPTAPAPPQMTAAPAPPAAGVDEPPEAPAVAAVPLQAAPPPAAAVGAKPELPGTGVFQVQLAALGTHEGAVSEWARLSRKMPELLANRHVTIVQSEQDGKVFYRLRLGGFADVAAADAFCSQVRGKGGACAVPHL